MKTPAEMTDEEVSEMQECFGISFGKSDDLCMNGCPVRDRCVNRIAQHYVPQLLAERGVRAFDLPMMTTALETDEDTARVVLSVRMGARVTQVLPRSRAQEQSIPAPQQEPVPPPVPEKPADTPHLKLVPPPEASPPAQMELPEVSEAAPVKKKQPPKKVLKESADPLAKEPKKKAAPVKKSPVMFSAEPVKEDTPAPKVVEAKAVPKKEKAPKAPTPKKVAAVKKRRPKDATPAPPPGTPERARAAFDRERNKSAWVAGLKHGQVLVRPYKGKTHTLKVDLENHRYVLDGKHFFTVYAATAAVAGVKEFKASRGSTGKRIMSAWSASRFWGAALKQAISAVKKSNKK